MRLYHHTANVKPTVEIMRASEADWAPRIPELNDFDWAYRVRMPHGNSLTGLVKGPKEVAVQEAERFIYKSSMSREALSTRKSFYRQYPKAKKAAQAESDEADGDSEDDDGDDEAEPGDEAARIHSA
jgi:hypothetical protein